MPGKRERGHYGWLAGVVVALLAQMTFSRHVMEGFAYADFLLLFVVYHAATKFEKGGLIAGAVAGFLQDCFSGGPLGLCGISLTLIGYGFGILSRRFLLARPLFYPLAVALASLAHKIDLFLSLGSEKEYWNLRNADEVEVLGLEASKAKKVLQECLDAYTMATEAAEAETVKA